MEKGSNPTLCIMFWNRNVPCFCVSGGQRSETLKAIWCGLDGHCLCLMWWRGWSNLGWGCDPIFLVLQGQWGCEKGVWKKGWKIVKVFLAPTWNIQGVIFRSHTFKVSEMLFCPRVFWPEDPCERRKTPLGVAAVWLWAQQRLGAVLQCCWCVFSSFLHCCWWCWCRAKRSTAQHSTVLFFP